MNFIITLNEGENNITVRTVDDNDNPSDFAQYQIVFLNTQPPLAEAGANIEIGLGKTPIVVHFDGSNSTDNLGVISNYTWIIDLQNQVYYIYGLRPTLIFDRAGDIKITLNISDQVDNYAEDYMWVNITQLDVFPPTIINRTPAVDSMNQSVNVTMQAKFNEPLNGSTISIKLISDVEGEEQIPSPKYDQVSGWLILKPFMNLTHERTYTVKIFAYDLAGNPLVNGIWNFSTGDRPEDLDGDELPDDWEEKYFVLTTSIQY